MIERDELSPQVASPSPLQLYCCIQIFSSPINFVTESDFLGLHLDKSGLHGRKTEGFCPDCLTRYNVQYKQIQSPSNGKWEIGLHHACCRRAPPAFRLHTGYRLHHKTWQSTTVEVAPSRPRVMDIRVITHKTSGTWAEPLRD